MHIHMYVNHNIDNDLLVIYIYIYIGNNIQYRNSLSTNLIVTVTIVCI